jgi:hypothetical protein
MLGAVFAVGAGNPPVSPGFGCGLLFGVAFGFVGYQTVTGTANDTLGNGLGSLILGLLAGGLVFFLIVKGELPSETQTIILLTGGLSVTLLILAGCLALAGRSGCRKYLGEKRKQRR